MGELYQNNILSVALSIQIWTDKRNDFMSIIEEYYDVQLCMFAALSSITLCYSVDCCNSEKEISAAKYLLCLTRPRWKWPCTNCVHHLLWCLHFVTQFGQKSEVTHMQGAEKRGKKTTLFFRAWFQHSWRWYLVVVVVSWLVWTHMFTSSYTKKQQLRRGKTF